MSEYEINQEIKNKQAEIEKLKVLDNRSMGTIIALSVLGIIWGIICLIVGIAMFASSDSLMFLGAFFLICGFWCVAIGCIFTPINIKKKNNAPFNIKKLESRIEDLKVELAKKQEAKNSIKTQEQVVPEEPKKEDIKDNVELLAKYKELLDKGAITQEEYDLKKKEILG